jgi:GNAT superfamily N-acetyltransferase
MSKWLVTSGKQDPETVARLLRSLPSWFGIESANADYVESARVLPTYLARPAATQRQESHVVETAAASGHEVPAVMAAMEHGAAEASPVGVLLARRHFPAAAEIHLMAVEPTLHRRGVGRALVEALESDLIADGCELLQVKTLSPSHPDPGYALTRQFYASMGFLPLEEMADLWSPANPCLIMVKSLSRAIRDPRPQTP